MNYLSKEIEALAKKRKTQTNSLIKNEYAWGIFQDYGTEIIPVQNGIKNKNASS
jgi:hypothetical protein